MLLYSQSVPGRGINTRRGTSGAKGGSDTTDRSAGCQCATLAFSGAIPSRMKVLRGRVHSVEAFMDRSAHLVQFVCGSSASLAAQGRMHARYSPDEVTLLLSTRRHAQMEVASGVHDVDAPTGYPGWGIRVDHAAALPAHVRGQRVEGAAEQARRVVVEVRVAYCVGVVAFQHKQRDAVVAVAERQLVERGCAVGLPIQRIVGALCAARRSAQIGGPGTC